MENMKHFRVKENKYDLTTKSLSEVEFYKELHSEVERHRSDMINTGTIRMSWTEIQG